MSKYLLFGIFFLGFTSACNRHIRTEAILPPVEVQGFESSTFSLYTRSTGGGTTALGQIFLPPKGHDFLKYVGFQCRHSSGYFRASDVNVKLRISAWAGDRPTSSTLWESEPVLVPKDINGWVSFDVPYIKLNPSQQYIAWLTMSDLQNADDASFGVVSMGPWTAGGVVSNGTWQPNKWTSAYPEGSRAFWRQINPDGQIDNMTQSPWITEGSGENLHFKMIFENMGANDEK